VAQPSRPGEAGGAKRKTRDGVTMSGEGEGLIPHFHDNPLNSGSAWQASGLPFTSAEFITILKQHISALALPSPCCPRRRSAPMQRYHHDFKSQFRRELLGLPNQ
jgi:hypothetical protein